MTSTCQFIAKRVRGLSSQKQHAAKLAKSSRNSAAHSPHTVSPATVGADMIGLFGGSSVGSGRRLGRDLAAQARDE